MLVNKRMSEFVKHNKGKLVPIPRRLVVWEYASCFILYQCKLFVKTQNVISELLHQRGSDEMKILTVCNSRAATRLSFLHQSIAA